MVLFTIPTQLWTQITIVKIPNDLTERKKLGIEITKNILQKNIFKNQWMEILDKSKKKDDLADSLLQGLWYMITKQMIDKKLLQ